MTAVPGRATSGPLPREHPHDRPVTGMRKVAATLAVAAMAVGLPLFATFGSFAGTDPFPYSVQAPR